MGKLFDLDSPLMRALTKVADIMILNLVTLLFFLPLILELAFFLAPMMLGDAEFALGYIFWAWVAGLLFSIPVGPALTGMHYVLLKIVRDEESYIVKAFFKSFKENFKQAAVLQIIQFFVGGILILDYFIMLGKGKIFTYVIIGVGFIFYMVSLYIFPVLAKFVNTNIGTLKNAFSLSILALPKTVVMVLCTALPALILYFFDVRSVPILILFGIAGPGFLCALLYNGTFKRFEPKEESLTEEEELDNAIKKIDEAEDEEQ
ncbi:YesL family protein [Butyrivibrio proteoclasticus]|uniref:YesL family protein n=1 Tax=Butyrivibrio proteoclasticus TaxID=43305 RepID=UPI00068727A8|nr:DUF624 domain-containing protein [Butyrivibrio proteoclasticus]